MTNYIAGALLAICAILYLALTSVEQFALAMVVGLIGCAVAITWITTGREPRP